MIAVFKHEIRNYFHTMTAYVFGAFLLAFTGMGATLYNLQAAVSNFEFVLSFGSLIFVVIVPVLTMRVIAEEKKQRTDQLLYSLPITTTQVVMGKYLALLVVYLIPLAIISLYPLVFSQIWRRVPSGGLRFPGGVFLPGSGAHCPGGLYFIPDRQPGLCGRDRHCGDPVQLLSCEPGEHVSSTAAGSLVAVFVLVIGLGLLIRYLTKNESLAYGFYFLAVAGLLAVYLTTPEKFEGLLPALMKELSLFERFSVFVNGVFDMTGIVFYVTFAAFFLFLSVQSLEKRRYN